MNRRHPQSNAPICNVDFYGEETLRDVVSAYRNMLGCGPVVWLEKNNLHAIVGFSQLAECLRNHQIFRSGEGVSINEDINQKLKGSSLNSDPPQHDVSRAITFRPLSPKALQSVRERIEKQSNFIVAKMVQQGEFDGAAELAPHVPLTVVRDLVGLGDHGEEHMLGWGAATFELMGDPRDRREKSVEHMKQLRAFLDDPETLNNLKHDSWADLATKRGIQEGMAPSKATELMRDYIAPSLDTTISAIGYGIMLFAQFPDQWEMLRQDRTLIRNAIEEIVRLNTPIRAFSRYLESDVTLEGVRMRKGDRVLMVYGAANRDSSRFEDPDTFNIERNVRGHMGFSHGVHACLGMHLARLEMTCLFEALADKVKRFEITGPIDTVTNSTIHALSKLPIRVENS